MSPRQRFTGPLPELACPLCLSKTYVVVTNRDPKRGLVQTIYRCEDCKSYFGDPRDSADEARGKDTP